MPLIDKAVLTLSNGEHLTIETSPNHPQQQFIHEITRNETSYRKLFFTHEDLLTGGTIAYQLGIVPNPTKHDAEDFPFSLTK